MSADATHSTDRQEVIVGQVHSGASTPPLYLAVDQSLHGPGRLQVFAHGHAVADLLTGIGPETAFTYAIDVPGDGSVDVAAKGEDLADAEHVSILARTFDGDDHGWYFKVGAYNKSTIDEGGRGYTQVRITDLALDDEPDHPAAR